MFSHLALVLSFKCCFSWMTLSHCMIQIRYAVFEMIICRSLKAPLRLTDNTDIFCYLYALLVLESGRLMHSTPIIRPRLISGHGVCVCGHNHFVRSQATCFMFVRHCVRMCSIDSICWHIMQNCLWPRWGICSYIFPIIYV